MIERNMRIPGALAWVVLMASPSCSLEDNHVSRDTRSVDLHETLSWLKQLSDEKFGGLSVRAFYFTELDIVLICLFSDMFLER